MRFPEWVVPMAATLTQERFSGEEWIFERKFDGIRLLAFRKGNTVRLFSRNQLPQDYPAVADAIAALPVEEVILDGEVDWGDRNVRLSRLRHPLAEWTRPDAVAADGAPRHLARPRVAISLSAVAEVTGPKPWERACREGWEGVIAKRRDSPYEHRRSPSWLKMKCEASQELVVGGFTDPQGERRGLGALLLGYFEGEDFVFAGKVGTGFNTKQLLELRARLDPIEIPASPFTKAAGLPRIRAHWVRPRARRAGRIHPMDRPRKTAARPLSRHPRGQDRPRSSAGDNVTYHGA